MRFDIDAEFAEDGRTIEMISLGIAAEDGRTFYVENGDFDWTPILDGSHPSADWLLEHVKPHLGGVTSSLEDIAADVVAFVGPDPEFWGWYADYDWLVLCQLFGRMIDLPATWPMFCRDAKQLHVELGSPVVPPHVGREHHALDDALHQQAVRLFLERRRPAALFYNPKWLALLGASLIEEVWTRFDFEQRFLDVSGLVLADGAQPWLRPRGPVAVAKGRSTEVWTPPPNADPGSMFVPGTEEYSFETSLDMDDMIAWAWGAARADVVESCVAWLDDMVRATIAGLFSHTEAVATRDRAELAIAFSRGMGEFLDMVLPNGVTVVYHPQDLVVASIGGLAGGAALVDGGERCVIRGHLKVAACLVLASARRLHLAAPGPVSTTVDG